MRCSVTAFVWMVLPACGVLAGCASWYADMADWEVERSLRPYRHKYPERPTPLVDGGDTPAEYDEVSALRVPRPPAWARGDGDGPVRVLTLADALAVATTYNRDYLERRETLYLTALALTGERHLFSVRPTLSWEGTSVDGADVDGTFTHTTLGEVSKILLFGGTVTLSAQQDAEHPYERGGVPDLWHASAAIALTQPLLKGFGYVVSHNDLIQARRDLIYDLRLFFQFRQDFSVDVAQAYWDLQRLRQRVRNQERSLKRFEDLKKRADARFEKGAAEAVDRFRAAREVLRARNDLNDERRAYAFALDQFKVRLGLPAEARIEVADDRPHLRPLKPDMARAVRTALGNRVDLKNAEGAAEDAERETRVARNALLATLDLTLRYDNATADATRFGTQNWGQGETTVGVRIGLPLDRTLERNAYRQALIEHDRARRAYTRRRDEVVIDVRERIRQLRVAESAVLLQRESVKQLQFERDMANIRVERGEASNRDVVDAQNRLLAVENQLAQAEVDHAIVRLRFWRSIGTLEIDERGAWRE